MRIKVYPLEPEWDLIGLYRKEMLGDTGAQEIELSGATHGHITSLYATYGDGTFEGDDRFYEFTSWCHARKHGDTLKQYRISQVHNHPLDLGVMSLGAQILLVARRPFVVITKDRNPYEGGSRPAKSRTNSRPIEAIEESLKNNPAA